jgi:Spy/CpxP family protein refolding chaperone
LAGLAILMFVMIPRVNAQPGPDDKKGSDDDRGAMRERIETVIIGKFASALELTPDQAEKFFPRLRQFHTQAEDWHKAQRDRKDQLDKLSEDPKADKAKVTDLLGQQAQAEQQMADMKKTFLTDVSAFLTPQQVSKCAILMDEMPRRVHQMIEERQERMREGGPGWDNDHPRHSRRSDKD